jgi:hypothetical protein
MPARVTVMPTVYRWNCSDCSEERVGFLTRGEAKAAAYTHNVVYAQYHKRPRPH